MKHYLRITTAILAVGMMIGFAGCGNGTKDPSSATEQTTIPATTLAQTTAPSTAAQAPEKTIELSALTPIRENGDDFAGTWKITDGVGDQYENFVYQFDGNGVARLIVGTMGYLQKYQLDTDSKTFTAQLMFGINGAYTYETAADKATITLKNKKSGDTTTLTRLDGYTCIPAGEKGDTDEKLLGAWQDEAGGYLYFDQSGVMYELQKGMTFTFYTYSAKDGVISGSYDMDGKQEINYKYTVSEDALTYNDYKYTRCSATDIKEMD